mmetsp:Transcript_30780/g.77235  ORF Transcript_30780/g.77235 Transcript_30780/m.77235 type:complete len:198 (+) Transcript_30780:1451-2044(+)
MLSVSSRARVARHLVLLCTPALGLSRSLTTRTSTSPHLAYAHTLRLKTRWKDNDMFGHVNNVEYYSYFDTVINDYLLSRRALTLPVALGTSQTPTSVSSSSSVSATSPPSAVGVCVESKCTYHASISFPDEIDCRLRVAHIGRSSVRYEIGIFKADDELLRASGSFTHVFVDSSTSRPMPIPAHTRQALQDLVVSER